MAALAVSGDDLCVHLNWLEKLGALRGDVRVPRAAIRAVRVTDSPFAELRGLRAPGTGFPGVIALGTRRGRNVRDFTAVYVGQRAVVVELAGSSFHRLIVCTADPERDAAQLLAALR